MNRAQIRRAERVSEIQMARRQQTVQSLQEAKEWQGPRAESGAKRHTIASEPREYTFTDEQFRIALASIEKATQ
jgi:uncharacterized protein YerC